MDSNNQNKPPLKKYVDVLFYAVFALFIGNFVLSTFGNISILRGDSGVGNLFNGIAENLGIFAAILISLLLTAVFAFLIIYSLYDGVKSALGKGDKSDQFDETTLKKEEILLQFSSERELPFSFFFLYSFLALLLIPFSLTFLYFIFTTSEIEGVLIILKIPFALLFIITLALGIISIDVARRNLLNQPVQFLITKELLIIKGKGYTVAHKFSKWLEDYQYTINYDNTATFILNFIVNQKITTVYFVNIENYKVVHQMLLSKIAAASVTGFDMDKNLEIVTATFKGSLLGFGGAKKLTLTPQYFSIESGNNLRTVSWGALAHLGKPNLQRYVNSSKPNEENTITIYGSVTEWRRMLVEDRFIFKNVDNFETVYNLFKKQIDK